MVDIDAKRLALSAKLIRKLIAKIAGNPWKVVASTERRDVMADSDYIVNCIEVSRRAEPDLLFRQPARPVRQRGLDNSAAFLGEIIGDAERAGVTLCMELLNSKVDHPDYQCDHTAWGVELCRRVGSGRLKLLYDIYHMQIMEGDVVRTIESFHPFIAHYHTAGNPGRHEIDDSQELNYRAVMRAIHATGFDGFVGHELIPLAEPMQSLREAVAICSV